MMISPGRQSRSQMSADYRPKRQVIQFFRNGRGAFAGLDRRAQLAQQAVVLAYE
jgi:hypothetical protein